jgi:hypothetical protein
MLVPIWRLAASTPGEIVRQYGPSAPRKEGLVAVAEAMELMKRTKEHMWQAELARIEGELRRLQGAPKARSEVTSSGRSGSRAVRTPKHSSWGLRSVSPASGVIRAKTVRHTIS